MLGMILKAGGSIGGGILADDCGLGKVLSLSFVSHVNKYN